MSENTRKETDKVWLLYKAGKLGDAVATLIRLDPEHTYVILGAREAARAAFEAMPSLRGDR